MPPRFSCSSLLFLRWNTDPLDIDFEPLEKWKKEFGIRVNSPSRYFSFKKFSYVEKDCFEDELIILVRVLFFGFHISKEFESLDYVKNVFERKL